jgi:hypothetical protein
MSKTEPQFSARPADREGEGWWIHVVWPSGKREVITGLVNQYHALDWIKHNSANWIADKIMRDPSIS